MAWRRKLAMALGAVLLGVPWAGAQQITAKEVMALVNLDGSAVIVENIRLSRPVARFDTELRVTRPGALANRVVFVDLLGVDDVSDALHEHPLSCHTRRHAGALRIECAAPAAAAEFKITYALRNAVEFLGDHDEFYYATAGAAESTSVRIVLPERAQGAFRAQSFLRKSGTAMPNWALWSSDGRLPVQIEAASITTAAPGPLLPQVLMATSVFLDKGVLAPPNPLVRAGWFLRANPVVLFPLATLLFMLVLRRLKGGARADRSIAPQYGPPDGLTPAEAGLLIDDRLDPRDIAATYVDLAARGYLRIEPCGKDDAFQLAVNSSAEADASDGAAGSGLPDFIFRKQRADHEGLAPHERTLLFHTFYGGEWTKLSSLRLRIPEIVPALHAALLNALRDRGFYRVDPEQAQTWRMVAVIGASSLLVLANGLGVIELFASQLVGALAVAASAATVYLLGRRMTAKTRRGMRAYIHLLGLEEFIRSVESDRLERSAGSNFEKLLPFAMALGLEHRWVAAFRGIANEAPAWFGRQQRHEFDASLLSACLEALTAKSVSVDAGPRGRRRAPVPPQSDRARAAHA